MILGTYSAIPSDTRVFQDKGNLSLAPPPCHLPTERLTCGLTNSLLWLPGCWEPFLLVWIKRAGFQMPSAVNSNSHCFCLFSPGTTPHMTGFVGSCSFSLLQLSLRITQLLSHLHICWQHTLDWVPANFY